ncbi:MAG: GH92 family glycosyl hydrolase [Tannerella sp.]|jgi:predicted alpha-1,2-mannosidase|nr:GH92 family glycosyl hydrolase [Tannerella sp.]
MYKNLLLTALAAMAMISCGERVHLSDYVNPFIGASTNTEAAHAYHGLGKTFPGAATPFGLTQCSPNTITGGDNLPGYSYEHTSIEGFAFLQMSGGGWYGELGNLLVMPTVGELKTVNGDLKNPEGGYRSRYDKQSEVAKAGYYSAYLTDYKIKAESTVTPHGGYLRFTFPENPQSRIQLDLARRVGGTSVKQYLQVVDDYTVRGWMLCTPDGGGFGNGAGKCNYTVYFYGRFSRPLEQYGFWSADIPDSIPRRLWDILKPDYKQRVANAERLFNIKELEGKHIGFFTEFPTREGEEVTFKAGISLVDMDGAEKNFKAELEKASFDKVRRDARALWDKALGKIEVSGGTDEDKIIFYTAMFHSMIDPRLISDVDGRFPGGDGMRPHQSDKYHRRSLFSGWDVFRSQFPLQTIINKELINDEINSFIALAEESGKGYYERWELLNAYSGCMIGNPAISVIADAYVKGIRDYDVEKAYEIAKNTSKVIGNGALGYTPGNISSTLEYAYSDWCMAVLAKALGKTEDEAYFTARAQNYRLIFDSETGWFRPRQSDGSWRPFPNNATAENYRLRHDYGCVESNPYQQGWFVPHDVDGMVELMGGTEKTLADLTSFFEHVPEDMLWNDYYNHANEPVHHIPFLFNRLGAPHLTQKWSRRICSNAYHNTVEGLVGNEDCGQMSAWYILAASGIHPVCPGETRYEITSPVFNEVKFRLESGKTFTVSAKDNSPQNIYIRSARLNGKPYDKYYIDYKDIMNGGRLELEMVSGN